MKIIVLVQHTESEHHINNHIGAWLDWNLTERGRAQAFRIGEWLNNAGCDSTWSMYVSPQRRALQTAEEINRSLGIVPGGQRWPGQRQNKGMVSGARGAQRNGL